MTTIITLPMGSAVNGTMPEGNVWEGIMWDARCVGMASVRFPDGTQYAVARSRREFQGPDGSYCHRYWVFKSDSKTRRSFKTFGEALRFVAERYKEAT